MDWGLDRVILGVGDLVSDTGSGTGSGHFGGWGFGIGHWIGHWIGPFWRLGIWYRALDRAILEVGDLVSGMSSRLGIWYWPDTKTRM